MQINVQDLVGRVSAIEEFQARIGWPDEPTVVRLSGPDQFILCLDAAMRAFRELRPGSQTLVDVDINAVRREVQIRVMQNGRSEHHDNVEVSVSPSFEALRELMERNSGTFHYWGGNNHFDLAFASQGIDREDFPEVKHLQWDERYRHLLQRATWKSLRDMAFRFCDLAELFAAQCVQQKLSTILIPSVGICVHPWLFAHHGLVVTATDSAPSALAALSTPQHRPKLFSKTAYERWDITECGRYATIPHPNSFSCMPDLADDAVRAELEQRIHFVVADWAELSLETRSVDAIFATNALPRESADERCRVLKEWVRVVKSGGAVFIAQHNSGGWDIHSFLQSYGWAEAHLLSGETPDCRNTSSFQILYSSG